MSTGLEYFDFHVEAGEPELEEALTDYVQETWLALEAEGSTMVVEGENIDLEGRFNVEIYPLDGQIREVHFPDNSRGEGVSFDLYANYREDIGDRVYEVNVWPDQYTHAWYRDEFDDMEELLLSARDEEAIRAFLRIESNPFTGSI